MRAVKTIVFPTDYSEYSNRAFPYATVIAEAFAAKIILLHIEGLSETDSTAAARDFMEQVRFSGDIETVRVKLKDEAPSKQLIHFAKERQCDLIVMATRGRSALSQFFLGGSLAEEVARYSDIPVFTVKVDSDQPASTYAGRLKEILFPTDLSEPSERAFTVAAQVARKFDARLIVLHVIDEDSVAFYKAAGIQDDGKLAERVEEFVKQHIAVLPGADAVNEIHIREGEAVSEILKFAEANGIDLIVMSTHGHTGIREDLIGSTPELVIRQARVPVLVGRA